MTDENLKESRCQKNLQAVQQMAVHYPTAPPTYSEVVEDPSSSIQIQNAVPATQVEISVKCK